MADWRTSEKYRKPRRTKGTPVYTLRNYWTVGIIGFGALSLYFFV